MAILRRVILNGFKSIKSMDLELRPLNVLIGANGAGKSNLVSFFKMLNEMIAGRLQQYIGTAGRAHSLLHVGPKVTPQLEAHLVFEVDSGVDTYAICLLHGAGDTLVFASETLRIHEAESPNSMSINLGAGYQESRLRDDALVGEFGGPLTPGTQAFIIRTSAEWHRAEQSAKVIRHVLNECRVYHFHDTSSTARVKQYCYIEDNRSLMSDAGNVAAMLYRFRKDTGNPAYRRILGTIRQIAPFIADFVLEPTGQQNKDVILNWQDRNSGEVFGPHQLSDGTLRFIALATLLLQPQALLPDVIVIDEPELGLHPAALTLVGGMLRSASHHAQIIVATQSAALVDGFAPDDLIVVNRREGASTFERLREEQLKEWLEDYTLGQLWEKNVVGGGPFG
jgi:predicted ATPase